jgi:hypothetical protein
MALEPIVFNFDSPAPPAGHSNIVFQDDSLSGEPIVHISAFDPLMVGDSGSGGLPGNVPAPGVGDAAAGKFFKADGTWSALFTNGSNASGFWEKNLITGHIRQWGVVTTDIAGGTLGVTFPVNFTSSGSISVVVTTKSLNDRITYIVDGSVTTSGFSVGNNGTSGYAYWSADGF